MLLTYHGIIFVDDKFSINVLKETSILRFFIGADISNEVQAWVTSRTSIGSRNTWAQTSITTDIKLGLIINSLLKRRKNNNQINSLTLSIAKNILTDILYILQIKIRI